MKGAPLTWYNQTKEDMLSELTMLGFKVKKKRTTHFKYHFYLLFIEQNKVEFPICCRTGRIMMFKTPELSFLQTIFMDFI